MADTVKPYFKVPFNRFDFIVSVSFWVHVILSIFDPSEKITIFKAISGLRPVRLLSFTAGLGVSCIVTTLTAYAS